MTEKEIEEFEKDWNHAFQRAFFYIWTVTCLAIGYGFSHFSSCY